MRDKQQIQNMRDDLDDNIWAYGWDAGVDGAVRALHWVLAADDQEWRDREAALKRLTQEPQAARKRRWIAEGGDEREWPNEELT